MSLESGYTAKLVVHAPGGDIPIVFEKWEGAELAPDGAKHRNAITRKETARGGLKSRGPLTLSRECDAEAWAAVPTLEDSSGIDRFTAVRQMIDARGTVIGEPFAVGGILGDIKTPDYDLAGNNVGMLQVICDCDEVAA